MKKGQTEVAPAVSDSQLGKPLEPTAPADEHVQEPKQTVNIQKKVKSNANKDPTKKNPKRISNAAHDSSLAGKDINAKKAKPQPKRNPPPLKTNKPIPKIKEAEKENGKTEEVPGKKKPSDLSPSRPSVPIKRTMKRKKVVATKDVAKDGDNQPTEQQMEDVTQESTS
ncbi:uncharacterized protein LOC106661000 [Cimex lectularius]|uniref:Uncharacterized protein n=1 Tax=Cimex lectularius TaxID=79782 RepID=A0A8I6TCN4_CIMLE|nr:uncharacterized protein LOC106661000 [Cimex lectularius]